MKDLIVLAAEIQQLLETEDRQFCFIGGLALLHWGEPRMTQDLDIVVFSESSRNDSCLDVLLKHYTSRVDEPRELASEKGVLLLQSAKGIGVDIALGSIRYEALVVQRSRNVEFGANAQLKICSAEDLVIYKAIANRSRDWLELNSIRIRQVDLDWNYILRELKPLVEAKGNLDIYKRVEILADS
ncbi:MAG: nucleotidyl transferase AbiEii/AbiGii toxin family protein [Verrucomicrobiota bacterium]